MYQIDESRKLSLIIKAVSSYISWYDILPTCNNIWRKYLPFFRVRLFNLLLQDPIDAANLIQNLTDNKDEGKVDAAIILYLLGDTLNRFNSTDGEAQEKLSQVKITIATFILTII